LEQFIGFNGHYNVQLIEGLESGSEFPIGTNEVDYLAILGNDDYQLCSFEVTVLSTGCTDIEACNYSEIANEDDGSCEYPVEFEDCDGNCLNDQNENNICDELENEGCTDEEACNYSESANIDDESCEYPEDLLDCDGNCLNDDNENDICDELEVEGCTNEEACNYNPEANVDNDSCDLPGEFLDCEGNCINDFNENGICDEAEVQGCMNPAACNYSEEANVENGSCEFPMAFMDCDGNCLNDENENNLCDETEVAGCTDADAVNYNADATFDDDSCIDECTFPEFGVLNISCDDELIYVELSVDANNVDGLFYLENSANNQTLVLQDGSSVLNLNFPYGEDVIATIQSYEYESCSMDMDAFACDVSILENTALEINMYPNPANDLVRISTGKVGQMNITLLDLTGKLILDQSTYMGVEGTELNLSDLADGTYLVRISDGNSIETRKLMILRK
ncbi:MAG: T9SS type A sorting domain-containing protein, partial [Flavobacteriales bacterium]